MQDVMSILRDYARLDLRRMHRGLSVPELERWALLKRVLDKKLKLPHQDGNQRDRRSSKRISTHLRCSFASCEELRRAAVTQLSTGGVFIATTAPLPVGTKLTLHIDIEDSDAEIDVEGAVVSTNISTDRGLEARGMGIRFTAASGQAVEQLSLLYARAAEEACERAETE